MKDIFDSPSLRALRALNESPTMRAIRAFERSPGARIMRQLDSSPALRMLRQLDNSSSLQAVLELENSSVMRMLRDLDDSQALKAMRDIQGSQAFDAIRRIQGSPAVKAIQAIDRSSYVRAFSLVAERLSHGYGALEFSAAYELLAEKYAERTSTVGADPNDALVIFVKDRVSAAPKHTLSAEFYLGIFFSLLLFLLSQVSSEQSEALLIKRMDAMEQSISAQLAVIHDDSLKTIYLATDRTLNIRSGPGAEYEIIGTVKCSQRVKLVARDGNWAEIEYFDYVANKIKQGWVNSRYFVEVTEAGREGGSNKSMQRTPLTGRR